MNALNDPKIPGKNKGYLLAVDAGAAKDKGAAGISSKKCGCKKNEKNNELILQALSDMPTA